MHKTYLMSIQKYNSHLWLKSQVPLLMFYNFQHMTKTLLMLSHLPYPISTSLNHLLHPKLYLLHHGLAINLINLLNLWLVSLTSLYLSNHNNRCTKIHLHYLWLVQMALVLEQHKVGIGDPYLKQLVILHAK